MEFRWRDRPLDSYAAWRGKIGDKNSRPGTSAPTLAGAWAGPLDVLAALRTDPALAGIALERVIVEKQSRFDAYSGPRNHDAVIHGRLPGGERVAVCIEAKAGETLGETVAQ